MIQPQYLQQQYPQAPSAVSINIYEPKSYGAAPQQMPYDYTTQMYSMPQTSAWGPQMQPGVQSPYQQYIPTAPMMPQYQPMPQYPMGPYPMPQAQQAPQAAPIAPQPMPQSAIEPQQAEQTQPPMPEVQQGEQAPVVNIDALLTDLKSPDFNTQAEAITSIANFTQATPDIALQVATDPVKQTLVDIINSDTSALPDVTPEQKALDEKQKKGEKLTPEEQAQLDQPSPKLAASKNKIFALFTLAMVQKLSRDNDEQYSQFQAGQGNTMAAPKALKDFLGFNEISGLIQKKLDKNSSDYDKELKIAAIQALQYMAKPEEKAEVEQILQPCLNDEDATVKQVAQEALAKLGGMTAPAEAAPVPEQAAAPAQDAQQNTAEEKKAA